MKTCVFFQRGSCNKGNACGFSHAQVAKNSLENDILRQVDYWFSDENFGNDKFLLGQATKEGYIPLNVVAKFPRMQAITTDQELIARAVEHSTVVQLSADRKMLKKKATPSNALGLPSANNFPYFPASSYNYFEESAAAEMNTLSSPFPMPFIDYSPQYYPFCATEYSNPHIYVPPVYALALLDPSVSYPQGYDASTHKQLQQAESARTDSQHTPPKKSKMPMAWLSPPRSPFVLFPPCPNSNEPVSPSYLDNVLDSKDATAYKAAGVLPFRYKRGRESVRQLQVLLGVEDKLDALVLLGGHRAATDEDTVATATREFFTNTNENVKAAADIESALRASTTVPGAVLWYREGRYVLYLVEMTTAAAISLTEHENSPPQANRRINKLAWVDVRTLLDAIRDGTVSGDARIKQGDTTFGISGTTKNVLSERPLLVYLASMLEKRVAARASN